MKMSTNAEPTPTQMKHADMCPECGASDDRNAVCDGCVTCTSCGLVLEEFVIDDRAEWRTFADEEDRGNRCGAAVSDVDAIIAAEKRSVPANTVIGKADATKQKHGTTFRPPGGSSCLARTQRYVEGQDPEKLVKSDVRMMDDILTRSSMNVVQDTRQTSIRMFVAFRGKHSTLKEPMKRSVMAMCVLYGSRVNSPKSLVDVMTAFGVKRAAVSAGRRLLNDTIRSHPDMNKFMELSHGMRGDSRDGIKRVVSRVVDVAGRDKWQVTKKSFELDDFAKEHGLVGSNDPYCYTIVVVMVACQELKLEGVDEYSMAMLFDHVSLATLKRHARTLRDTMHTMHRVSDNTVAMAMAT